MSDTDSGAEKRPSSGSSGSTRPAASGGDDTRPLSTTGSPGGAAQGPGKVGSERPRSGQAEADRSGAARSGGGKPAAGRPGAGRTATAVAVKAGAGKQVAKPGARGPAPRPSAPAGRRVRLTVSRVDPWSAMKLSFLLSVAFGISLVVMTFVLWTVLNVMCVFDHINNIAGNLFPVDSGEPFDLMNYIGLPKVMSLAIVVGVIDVILITALATLGAFLYNVSAALVGGLQLTLTDD